MSQIASPLITGAAFLGLSYTTVEPMFPDDTFRANRMQRWTSAEPTRGDHSIVGAELKYAEIALTSPDQRSPLSSPALSTRDAQRLALFEAGRQSLIALVRRYPDATRNQHDADPVSAEVSVSAVEVLMSMDSDMPLPRVSATRDGEVALLWKFERARVDAAIQGEEHLVWVESDRGDFVDGGDIDLQRQSAAPLWMAVRRITAAVRLVAA